MITFQSNLLPLQEVFNNILISRKLSDVDFNLLSLVLLSDYLSDEDKRAVERIFYALRRGRLTLIDISDEQRYAINSWLESVVFAKAS